MPTSAVFNGVTYQVPANGDRNYGAYTTTFLLGVASGAGGKAAANTWTALQQFSAGIKFASQTVPAQGVLPFVYSNSGHVYALSATGGPTTAARLTQAWLAPIAAHAVVVGPTSGADAYATARALAAADIPSLPTSQITGLDAALAAKADDSLVVHLAGIETITGAKTFSLAPTLTLGATYGATAGLTWTGRSVVTSPADGIVLLQNNAASGFTRLQFGGTTASFPSLKRSATAVAFRLADDSADAPITAAQGTFSALVSLGATAGFTAASSTNNAPALFFSNTSNTGFFAGASGTTLGATVAGTTVVSWTAALATYAVTLSLPAGSAGTPSVAFGTAGTGIYGGGAVINFSSGSAIQFQMSATQFTATQAGSASAPLYCFAGSTTTGLFSVANTSVSTSVNGIERVRVGLGTTGNPIQTLRGAGDGSGLVHQCTSTGPTTVTAASTTVATIPAGSLVLAVTARVTTTISGGGVTSFQLGDAGVGTTQYGTGIALTSGTTTTIANTTLTSPKFYAASTNITFTPVGGTPAAGAVRVEVYYILVTAPTS